MAHRHKCQTEPNSRKIPVITGPKSGSTSAATIAAAIVGLSKGGIPAIGMLAVPIMALTISPIVAVGMLLPVYLASDLFGVWEWRKKYSRKILVMILPGALLGTLIGWLTSAIVPHAAVTMLIGLLGFGYSAWSLLYPSDKSSPTIAKIVPGAFWGTVTGFTSFVSYAGAPTFQIFVLPLRLDKEIFIGTSTITFAILNIAKIVPYTIMGELTINQLYKSLFMMPPAVIAVFAGVWLVKVIPQDRFFLAVLWALFILSIKLTWDGSVGMGWI